jgi:hypothetical protein
MNYKTLFCGYVTIYSKINKVCIPSIEREYVREMKQRKYKKKKIKQTI